jgi:hypothetical protein
MRSVSKRVSSSRDISILTTYSSRAITQRRTSSSQRDDAWTSVA